MQGRIGKLNWILATASLLVCIQSSRSYADNCLAVKWHSQTAISIELSNSIPVAGLQFSVVAEGGITLDAFEESVRLTASGMRVFQYLANDSTLNIVLLARVQSSLPAGTGGVGTVSFTTVHSVMAETLRVKLNRVVLCSEDAKVYKASTESLEWSTATDKHGLASAFHFEPNYPNPFNPSTTIVFSLHQPGFVHLSVYDVAGREISTLIDRNLEKGRYSVRWSMSDVRGAAVASGIYFARLKAGTSVGIQKMIFTK